MQNHTFLSINLFKHSINRVRFLLSFFFLIVSSTAFAACSIELAEMDFEYSVDVYQFGSCSEGIITGSEYITFNSAGAAASQVVDNMNGSALFSLNCYIQDAIGRGDIPIGIPLTSVTGPTNVVCNDDGQCSFEYTEHYTDLGGTNGSYNSFHTDDVTVATTEVCPIDFLPNSVDKTCERDKYCALVASAQPNYSSNSCGVGNPCYPATGNKRQIELDYSSNSNHPLILQRFYNSEDKYLPLSTFAPSWLHSFSSSMDQVPQLLSLETSKGYLISHNPQLS